MTFFDFLSQNPTLTTVFIVALSALAITIIFMYVKAFFIDKRAVSFWPPKIGEKPVSPVITDGKSSQVKPLQDLHTGEETQFEKLGHTVRSFGIATITKHWSELAQFDGNLGREFKERLKEVKASATWYIITMSPEAFSGAAQLTLMEEAANRGVDIKWAYQTPDLVLDDPALQVQWKWINLRYDDIAERATPKALQNHLQSHIAVVEDRIQKWKKALKKMPSEERRGCGKWEVYYSRAPNFYLTWLSVPAKHSDDMPLEAPLNTFGFVHLYVFFPRSYEKRAALYFDNKNYPSNNSQEILNYYYQSTVQFFSKGVKPECGYLPDSPKRFQESS